MDLRSSKKPAPIGGPNKLSPTVFSYQEMLTPPTKKDLIKEKQIKLLAGIDSIHDFDDEGGRVSTNSAQSVATALINALSNLKITTNKINNYKEWLIAATINGVSSPSNVEDQTVFYYEKNYTPKLNTVLKKIITYRDIINKIKSKTSDINTNILNAGQELFGGYDTTCILDIDLAPGENWDTSYSPQDKVWIALFMLNYFFPPPETKDKNYNTQLPSYITFDAGSNIPSKIFGRLDQVINLITPLNIADSAATGENHLIADGKKNQKRAGVKNKYAFPENSANQYTYTSNIYTSSQYKLSITKPAEYNEKNKNQFQINITTPTNSVIPSIVFDAKHTVGPSVAYLSDTIAGESYEPERNMADLRVLSNNKDPSLLLDLKRSGDWEQCNAAYTLNRLMESTLKGRVILCTIDRLCALYSRCIGQNTIWHCGTHLKLYRFPGMELSQKEIDKINAEKEKKAQEINTQKIKAINNIKDSFKETIKNLENIVDDYKKPYEKRTISRPFFDKNPIPINRWLTDVAIAQLRKSIQFLNEMVALNVKLQELPGVKVNNADTVDPDEFFKRLYSYNTTVDYLNYSAYITEITSFTTLAQKTNKPFFAYTPNVLLTVKQFLVIVSSIPDKSEIRITKYLSTKNMKTEYENNGYFDAFKQIEDSINPSVDSPDTIPDTDTEKYKIGLNDIEFKKGDSSDYGQANVDYLVALKERLTQFLNENGYAVTGTTTSSSNLPPTMSGGGEHDEEIKKLFENVRYGLSEEFATLCASIGDIVSDYYTATTDETLTKIESSRSGIKQILIQSINPDNDRPNVEEAILNFCQACHASIVAAKGLAYELDNQWTTNEGLNTEFKQIIRNYRYVYAFLSMMLTTEDDIIANILLKNPELPTKIPKTDNQPEDVMKQTIQTMKGYIESSPADLQKPIYTVSLEGNTNTNITQNFTYADLWRTYTNDGLFGEKSIYYEFFNGMGDYGYSTDDIEFMIRQCIKIQGAGVKLTKDTPEQKVEPINVVIAVFLFFQNYFKYVILKKTSALSLASEVDLSNYGYYQGVISGFNNIKDAEEIIEYLKLTVVAPGTNTYESDEYKRLFEMFNQITFRILLFIRDEETSAQLQYALLNLKGGKNDRTLKIRKISGSQRNRKSNRRVRKLARLQRTHRKRIGRRAMSSNRKARRSSSE